MATDILYQDEDICILHPDSRRGTLVYYVSGHTNICNEGLLTYNEVRRRHPELGFRPRTTVGDSSNKIIFRAPFTADLRTFKTAFKAEPKEILGNQRPEIIVIIRIDPAATFVYSSEARTHNDEKGLKASRIPFNEYIRRIAKHKNPESYLEDVCGNVYTYESKIIRGAETCIYPWIKYLPVQRNAEVVAKIPHIPPTWFVTCYTNSARTPKSARQ
jgi:hypothetical protein